MMGPMMMAMGTTDGGLEFALKPKGLGQGGQFQFSVDGPAVNYFTRFLGDGFHVESSTDLKQWNNVELLKATDEETVFQDGGAGDCEPFLPSALRGRHIHLGHYP